MFTKAGIRTEVEVLFFARVSRYGVSGSAWGWLVRWPHCGDIAWASATRVEWPEQVRIVSVFKVTFVPGPWGVSCYIPRRADG